MWKHNHLSSVPSLRRHLSPHGKKIHDSTVPSFLFFRSYCKKKVMHRSGMVEGLRRSGLFLALIFCWIFLLLVYHSIFYFGLELICFLESFDREVLESIPTNHSEPKFLENLQFLIEMLPARLPFKSSVVLDEQISPSSQGSCQRNTAWSSHEPSEQLTQFAPRENWWKIDPYIRHSCVRSCQCCRQSTSTLKTQPQPHTDTPLVLNGLFFLIIASYVELRSVLYTHLWLPITSEHDCVPRLSSPGYVWMNSNWFILRLQNDSQMVDMDAPDTMSTSM